MSRSVTYHFKSFISSTFVKFSHGHDDDDGSPIAASLDPWGNDGRAARSASPLAAGEAAIGLAIIIVVSVGKFLRTGRDEPLKVVSDPSTHKAHSGFPLLAVILNGFVAGGIPRCRARLPGDRGCHFSARRRVSDICGLQPQKSSPINDFAATSHHLAYLVDPLTASCCSSSRDRAPDPRLLRRVHALGGRIHQFLPT